MKLIIVRHSQTIEANEWHEKVELRPLSKTGRIRAEVFGKILEKKYKHSFQYFYSSEYRRSIETAEILRKYLKPVHFLITDALNPDRPPDEIINVINKTPESKKYILLVGHIPFIENLVSVFIGRKEHLEFKKPSMCELEISEGKGKIVDFFSYDDIPDNIKIPIKKATPYEEEIEELELG
ncbi:MAG: histidine phosphatase family protein [Brevinematales bacterium]|nr:histidine phosphatase family protein [Brevinematales bacterium]